MGKRNSFVVSVFDVTFSRKNTGIREYFFFVIFQIMEALCAMNVGQ